MNSIDRSLLKQELNPLSREMTPSNPTEDSKWIENSALLACWIGVVGLILLISHAAWARDNAPNSLHPSSNAFNPFTSPPPSMGGLKGLGAGKGNQPPAQNYSDDDDDDFEDDFFPGGPGAASQYPAQYPYDSSSRQGGQPSKSYSAGGSPSNVPDPIRTQNGVSIGGGQANGVVSKNAVTALKIDDETAEGSKEMITDFNFPDADILDIAKTLGKLTGKNFIYDKDVKGRISIISNSPITAGEAWKAFLTALDVNQFALVPSGKYLRITRQRDARDKQLNTYSGDFSPNTDALITRIFQLKYLSAEEVVRTFRNFMPANSRIIPYEQTNNVIVTDTGANIAKLAKILEVLDMEGFDAGIEVIPVKYASAAEISKLIDTLIPGTSSMGGPPGGSAMPRFGGSGARFSARRTKEGGVINTVIADERTNTLIVHANTKGTDQVRELVAKLDQKIPTSTGGGKVHVVYLQFADSEQMANTLNNFSAQSGSSNRPGGGMPGGPGGGTGMNPNAGSLFEGAIKISPDKATNALVITASPSDFVTVQRVINRLDISRDQVYVEVIIMEVQIGNNFNFSANIISAPSLLGSVTDPKGLSDLFSSANPFSTSGALLSFAGGQSYSVTVPGSTTPIQVSSLQGFVRAIQTNASTNVLATPQIIALDNSEANFESAEKIPVQTQTSVQGAGVSTGFTKESVALSIKIKPQINKLTNFVKLDITTKIGDINNANVPASLVNQAFGTIDRTAQTTVVVGDSDTVVLGGLTRDKISETINKIPLLGDIPLLGWLFKSKTSQVAKNNLLIFLTPKIIRQYDKIRAILDQKLRERDNFIESNAGGTDPMRSERDRMIRSLPELKDLNQKHTTTVTIDDDKAMPLDQTPGGYGSNPAAVAVPDSSNPQSNIAPAAIPAPPFNPEDRAPLTPETPPAVDMNPEPPANPAGT